MRKAKGKYFKLILYSMVGASYFTIGLSGKLDLPFNFIFLIGIVLTYIFGNKKEKRPLKLYEMSIIFILFFAFFSADYLFYSGEIILSTAHIAILALIFKLFNIKSGRDYFYIFLLSLSIILISTTITFDLYFLICLLWFLASSIILTMLFEIKTSSEKINPETTELKYLPENLDTFLKKEKIKISSIVKTGIISLTSMVVITIPLFLTMPRFSISAFDINFGMKSYISGFSNETEIGDVGKILKNSKVVMRVVVNRDIDKIPENIKWRGIGLDKFDGRRWYVSSKSYKLINKNPRDRMFYLLKRNSREILLKSTFYVEPGISEVLFVPWRPIAISGKFNSLILNKTESVKVTTPIFKKFKYEAFSDIYRPSIKQLEDIKKIDIEKVLPATLEIPDYNKRIYELVKKITKGKKTPIEKVLAILKYLKKNYRYSLNLKPLPKSEDPIYHFLFISKKGHCEYFASAMAIMVRYLKIPSRLINGFRKGDYNELNQTFVVRELHAHSWVEIYFNQYGWISFDPTPPGIGTFRESFFSNIVEAITFLWIKNVINYDFSDQIRLFWKIHNETIDYKKKMKKFRENIMDKLATYLQKKIGNFDRKINPIFYGKNFFLTVIIIFSLPILIVIFLKKVKSREKRKIHQNLYSKIMGKLFKEFKKSGLEKKKGETVLEFKDKIKNEEIKTEFYEITKLYYYLRFGRGKEMEQFRKKVENLILKLKKEKGGRK